MINYHRSVDETTIVTCYVFIVVYFTEAKTVTINRMQSNLQEWDKQIKDILEKKAKNGKCFIPGKNLLIAVYITDTLCTSELANRDQKIKELSESYSSEHKIRTKTEKQRDKLTTKLVSVHAQQN